MLVHGELGVSLGGGCSGLQSRITIAFPKDFCLAESVGFLIDWKAGSCSDLGDLSSERTLFRPFLA